MTKYYYLAVKLLYKLKNWKRRIQTVETAEALESLLSRTEELHIQSPMAALDFARTWFFSPKFTSLDRPNSKDYDLEQQKLYEMFSGKVWGTFDSVAQEDDIKFDSLSELYPYAIRDPQLVGTHLLRVGYWMKAMNLKPTDKILEFGSGSAELSLYLAQTGFDVLATDISLKYTSMIAKKAALAKVQLKTAVADMTNFTSDEKFDVVLFCEAFHHSAHHVQLLDRLQAVLNPGGRVYLFGEPVTYFPYPWGVRTDGESIWMARKHGWLELGFDQSYFKRLVHARGWTMTSQRNKSIDHAAYVICLTK